MKTNLVYFDYGNVICIDPDPHFFNHMSGMTSKSVDEVKSIFIKYFQPFMSGQITEKEFYEIAVQEFKGSFTIKQISTWFPEVYTPHLKPKQEILQIAKRIRYKGIKTGILSNIVVPLIRVCRENSYYAGFSPLILSPIVGSSKPDIEIYKVALREAGGEANPIVFIDDKEKYLEPAKELGFRTVHFNNANETASDLERKLIEVGVEI